MSSSPMDKSPKIIKCLVMDDEPLAQEVIARYIQRIPSLRLVAQCENAIQALTILQQQEVDLLFADIRMPELLGTDLIKILQHPPQVIITTAYAEYALESYEFNVIDYLLKPISFDRFSKAVNKITDKLAEENEAAGADHIFIKANGKFCKVNFSEILYIEGMRDYLKIHMPQQTLMTLLTMNEFERSLPKGRFIRIHKSYIAAVGHISAVYGNSVELGKETIPIGLNYREMVMNFIGKKTR